MLAGSGPNIKYIKNIKTYLLILCVVLRDAMILECVACESLKFQRQGRGGKDEREDLFGKFFGRGAGDAQELNRTEANGFLPNGIQALRTVVSIPFLSFPTANITPNNSGEARTSPLLRATLSQPPQIERLQCVVLCSGGAFSPGAQYPIGEAYVVLNPLQRLQTLLLSSCNEEYCPTIHRPEGSQRGYPRRRRRFFPQGRNIVTRPPHCQPLRPSA